MKLAAGVGGTIKIIFFIKNILNFSFSTAMAGLTAIALTSASRNLRKARK